MTPVAPVPATAVIWPTESATNDCAAAPPIVTAVGASKPEPLMLIAVPAPPLAGVKPLITGSITNPIIEPAPPGPVTTILPELPLPNTAVSCVSDTTLNDVAGTPPNVTAVMPVKYCPVSVMVLSPCAVNGENELITGPGKNLKPATEAVFKAEYTETFPEAPVPTTAVTVDGDTMVNDDAGTPPNSTPMV